MTIRAERTLPIDAAHREFTVLVDGKAVPREHHLVSARILSAANRVASARLVYADGAPASSDFPLSNQPLFAPGAKIEVRAGSASQGEQLFVGVVVRQCLRVRGGASPQLQVDCRHAAFRLGLRRHSRNHLERTDSEVVEDLAGGIQLPCVAEATQLRHPQLVQADASDWDFIVVRAAANGQAVLTRGSDLVTRTPSLSAEPVVALQYGATLIELDAELDARPQAESVATLRWDAAQQAVAREEAEAPGFDGPGNLAPDALAQAMEAGPLALSHHLPVAEEARSLAQAHWRQRQVDKIRGRLYCEGLGKVMPGDVVDVQGIGDRFSGKVWISGVLHELDLSRGWKTHLQFGGVEPDEALQRRLSRPRAATMVATMPGLQAGVVTGIEDPEGEHRVRVRLPLVNADDDGIWARVATLDAGSQRGVVFRPEPGDEVVVGFFDDDPRWPVVLGMLHSSAKPAPIAVDADNPGKGLVTRSGLRLIFDDGRKALALATPGGRELRMSDADGVVALSDGDGNRILLDKGGITLETRGTLRIKAGDGSVQTAKSLRLKAGSSLVAEGASGAEVKSAGVAKLTGAMVQIN